jgi:hypothetical protein
LDGVGRDEGMANARAMVAAPQLLEALTVILRRNYMLKQEDLAIAISAIQKATGKTDPQ